jgi:uncharacterized protein (TIGR03086 family)
MSDLLDFQQRATEEFDRRVAATTDDQWKRPTPCADWDVRALVNHVVYEDLWAPHLARGETVEQVGDRYEGDQLGSDPKAAWRDASDVALAAFRERGALDRTVHLSYGDETAPGYLSQLVTDHLIHAWDLARGIGHDDTLDPDLVSWAWEAIQPHEQMVRQSGLFGERIDVPDGADVQTKLLAFVGRRRSG